MTNQKRKTSEVEHRVKPISNGAHIYLLKDWIGKKVKTILLTSIVVLILVTLMTSQAVAIAKKQQQPKQAVDNPSAGKSNDDQPT
jgi:putative transposon-encoded protein